MSSQTVICSYCGMDETSTAHIIVKTQNTKYVGEYDDACCFISYHHLKLSKEDLHEALMQELYHPRRIEKWINAEHEVEDYLDLNPNSNFSYGTNNREYTCYGYYLDDITSEDLDAFFESLGVSLK